MTRLKLRNNYNKKGSAWFYIIAVFMLSFFISKFFFQIMLIQGDSMEPYYHNMQFVIISKLSKTYTYNDVIAINNEELNSIIVKRIVACQGDMVVIKDKKLYVNNIVSNIHKDSVFEYAGILEKEIELKEDEYVVIGDNVIESKDSSYKEIGIINKKDIIGVILDK